MNMKTLAILGAGAIGSYFIWGLSDKLGENLWVVADGERKERLETQGVTINDKHYDLHVRTPQEAHGADVLLVCVKAHALDAALEEIAAVVDEHTTVLSLLNGVTSEEIIGKRIGMEHVLYATMRIASERREDGVHFDGPNTPGLFFGEPDSPEPSARMQALSELLADTPLHVNPCDDIIRELWDKLALNIGSNLAQAILGVGIGAYKDSEYAGHLSQRLRQEAVAVAAAKGVDISVPKKVPYALGIAKKAARYSTLQDLDAGRHTEIDLFAGNIVEMGREMGVSTPYNEFAYNAIKALEEKNDGKFDY